MPHDCDMNSCLIADDHPPIVSALTRYLEENDFTVVGTAATGDEALEKPQRMHPQVALLDIRMPGLGGIDVVRRLRETTPETALVVYTGTTGTAELNDALDAGAGDGPHACRQGLSQARRPQPHARRCDRDSPLAHQLTPVSPS